MMVLIYVNDMVSMPEVPMIALDRIKGIIKLKGNKAKEPNISFGRSITKAVSR